MKKLSILMIFCVLCLYGCGAGRTFVMEPCEKKYSASSVQFSEGASTVQVPVEIKEKLKSELDKLFYEERLLKKGEDLTIEFSVIQYDPGSRFKRYMWGGIGNSGEGSLSMKVAFYNSEGKKLSMIQTEGTISSGLFGGSFENAVEKAALEVAEHVDQNYR